MVRDRFQFLKSFADTITNVSQADENLAKDLALKIINYGIYGEERDSWNPILEAIFIQIKLMIDKWKSISEANSINGKKWWRPIKNWENSQKANWNPNESETKAKKSKIENIKYKKENILDNNINVITETKSFWNENINQCLDLISKYNGGLVDGTKQNGRRYSKLLIDKLNKLEKIQNWEFTWYDTLEIILKVISNNKYYASKITSPENIYRNLSVLMQQCKADIWKANTSQTVLPVL